MTFQRCPHFWSTWFTWGEGRREGKQTNSNLSHKYAGSLIPASLPHAYFVPELGCPPFPHSTLPCSDLTHSWSQVVKHSTEGPRNVNVWEASRDTEMFPTGCRTTGKLGCRTKPRWAGSAYHVLRPQVLGSCQSFSCLVVEDCLLNFLGSYKTVGSQASGDYGSGGNRNCFGGAHSLPAPSKMGSELSQEKEPWTSAGNIPMTLTITENLEWNQLCNSRQSFKALVRLGRPLSATVKRSSSGSEVQTLMGFSFVLWRIQVVPNNPALGSYGLKQNRQGGRPEV